MLNRLGIRQKLTVLLMIPLTAVVLVLVPFTVQRIADARSAGTTARAAQAARQVGGLIETLQQERLLALGYLSVPSLDRSTVVSKSQEAVDETARLRADPLTADVLAAAEPALATLSGIRDAVLAQRVDARTVYTAFRDANSALLNALRLSNPQGADAEGLGQLGALDELMRSNEEASSVGTLLVAAAADPALSRSLLTDAAIADQQHLQRFRQLVPADQSALVDTVEAGRSGQRIRQLLSVVTDTGGQTSPQQVSDALTAAVSYADLRRFAQDRLAREVTTGAQSRAAAASGAAYAVVIGAAALLALVAGLGLAVSRSISRPLRRLTRAATMVAELSAAELVRVADSDTDDAPAPRLAAVQVDSADEIGELAQALNRVQTTAAMLLERQVSTRRNVAVMFANIARRTQNLVGRQLNLIDDLERNERSPQLLQRLYRLDHVATRLRRSADSLLVVSGTIDQVMAGGPTLLADVVRSALTEIEGYASIDIDELPDVGVVSSLAGDLRLLLAELLENATNFSPPGSRVSISASVRDECRIVVVDHGLGLSQARLDEENRRLLERERLDVAPTTVLGLFVVGRLARRHGLSIRLDHTPGRGITATVRIPLRLLADTTSVRRGTLTARVRPTPRQAPLAIDAIDVDPGGPFPWFVPPRELPAGPPAASGQPALPGSPSGARKAHAASVPPARPPGAWPPGLPPGPPPGPPPQTSAGLARRIPGTHMQPDELARSRPTGARARRDPEAERDLFNGYQSGLTKSTEDGLAAEPSRSTLAERHS